MKISGVQSVNLNDVYFPIYSKSFDAGSKDSAQATPILPGEQDITTTVSVVFFFNSTGTSTPSGATGTKDNTNCTNPLNGPMIC